MKKYPRIYSLSTVNLIHHQENDYSFNSSRTDFIGDSASGKSIVADLLQLILVGSTAFKSATATLKDPREPNGLVLTSPGKGTNIGYAILNIEVANEQFIAIGAYFESTNKSTKSFIIQTSTKIEEDIFVPMSKPVKYSDFKNGDYIFELDEMIDVMEEKQLILKKIERISSYHRLLFKNDILPLNLASSDKILNDYAKILQSFSRGKTLETHKSKSILDFLFGQERGKELLSKYTEIAKDFENSILAYGQNLESIKILTDKCNKVCSLKKLLEIKDEINKEYLSEELYYYIDEYNYLSRNLSINVEKINSSFSSLTKLVKAVKSDIEEAKKKEDYYNQILKESSDFQFKAKLKYENLKAAQQLLDNLNIKEDLLDSFYKSYQKKKELHTQFKELNSKLSEKNLNDFFEKSEWIKSIKYGNGYFTTRIAEIKLSLEHLDLLSEYADINNPESLVRWAISLNRSLSETEESIILHFQKYRRTEPEKPLKADRFLPSPEALFNNLKTIEKNGGFWIDLGGIWEYVEYVSARHFNTLDKKKINSYFESEKLSIKQQIKDLEYERECLIDTNNIIIELSNASQCILAYQSREECEDFQEIEILSKINGDIFLEYLSCLTEKDKIKKEYEDSQRQYDKAFLQQKENLSILKKLPSKMENAEILLQSVNDEYSLLSDLAKQFYISVSQEEDLSFYHDSDDKLDCFNTELVLLKDDIELVKTLRKEKEELDEINKIINEKKFYYESHYSHLPDIDNNKSSNRLTMPSEKALIEATTNFNKEFGDIVRDYIPNESHRYEDDNKSFPDLVAHILPDIFENARDIGEDVIEKIESHLKQINDKNRDLNSKKIQKIEDLLDDVRAAVSEQTDIIRKINRFFNTGEKKISGNYQLNLVQNPAKGFPIDWLTDFKRQAGQELDLFKTSIADRLSEVISIKEKIIRAFHEITDNRNKDIKIDDLLNPNSYMELSLEMVDKSGKSNRGSTGQTYAAVASLCIARLSIVGNKETANDKGIRFMPIDEAEGLGSNFELLYEIAQNYDYQIFTFAINPLGRYDNQSIYILHRNVDSDASINYTPMAIHSANDIKDELKKIITL